MSARAVGVGDSDRGEEAVEVVGEVLGRRGGGVDRRHGQVVAHPEAGAIEGDPLTRERARQHPVVGDDEHAPDVEADGGEGAGHKVLRI